MHKLIMFVLLLALVGFASAQYQPSSLTQIEIQAAAAFTDGIVVTCPDSLLSSGDYMVCVDVSNTPWDSFDLMDWSDYGLSGWVILAAWADQGSGIYMKGLYHPTRKEGIIIAVTPRNVYYQVYRSGVVD